MRTIACDCSCTISFSIDFLVGKPSFAPLRFLILTPCCLCDSTVYCEKGQHYTLKVRLVAFCKRSTNGLWFLRSQKACACTGGENHATRSAHPARFSPDDKFSSQRITLKKRFGILPTQQVWPACPTSPDSHAVLCCSRLGNGETSPSSEHSASQNGPEKQSEARTTSVLR